MTGGFEEAVKDKIIGNSKGNDWKAEHYDVAIMMLSVLESRLFGAVMRALLFVTALLLLFHCNADKKSGTNLMKGKFAVTGISAFRKRLHSVIEMYCLWDNRRGMIINV